MPNTILSSPYSAPSLSIVSQALQVNVAAGLSVSKVGIKYTATAFRHKREDGTSVVDARILNPTRVDIDVIVGSIDVLEQVNDIILDKSSAYTITSKGLVMTNMMMDRQQIKQAADIISASPVRMSFTQVLVQGYAPNICAQSADNSLLDKGLQLVNKVTVPLTTLVDSVKAFVISGVPSLGSAVVSRTWGGGPLA